MNSENQSLARSGAGAGIRKLLYSYQELLQQELSRNRFAEEREWYEEALFYQRRQWLKWDNSNKRWSVLKQDPDKPRPMPVTNHYARQINAIANQLAGGSPRTVAIPNDDSDANRQGAKFAEKAVDAIDVESGFDLQRPLLGKHVALWGIGVTKDYQDPTATNGVSKVPQLEMASSQMLGCLNCGQIGEVPGQGAGLNGQQQQQQQPPAASQPIAQPRAAGVPDSSQTGQNGQSGLEQNSGAAAPDFAGTDGTPCPGCGSTATATWTQQTPVIQGVKQFSEGKITTEVRPIFEFYLPRDCQGHPNLAKKLQHRYRKPVSEAKRLYPDFADQIRPDEKQDVHEIYLEALRSLVNYNYMHDASSEGVTITETWVDFSQLPENVQEALVEACQAGQDEDGEPVEYPDAELDPVDQLTYWGIYIIAGGGIVLDWGINNLEGHKPFTFFVWEVDPANVYPMGPGSNLVPLQKRLNRIDSLIELAMMSNAAGKWLWPTTQTTKPPTGSPSDVVEYDPIGDGKIAPSFVAPTPVHATVWTLRAAIKQDFLEIGGTEGIQLGQNPKGVTAFRGLAYLGAKSSEQTATPRYLWETALALRHKKCLILAKRNWTAARKVKVAGFNGRWGMKQMTGSDLEGDYTIEIVENSSRPRTLDEKQQVLAMLLQGGLVDPTDPDVREYVLDETNLDRINLVNHLQYLKAERDLDKVIAGQMDQLSLNPYINVQIFLKTFINYTLTEEFEQLDPGAQQRVMAVTQALDQMAQAQAQAAMMAQAQAAGAKLGGAMAGQKPGNPGLNGVPGQTTTPDASSAAAEKEGSSMASQMP